MVLSVRSSLVRTLIPFFAAFIAAAISFLAAQQGLLDARLWTMVAPIAVLLPGAVIVTGLTELAAGSMNAGTARLGHGTTQLLLFALGLGAAVVLGLVSLTRIEVAPDAATGAVGGVTVIVAAIALGVIVGASLARPRRSVTRRVGLLALLRRLPARRRSAD